MMAAVMTAQRRSQKFVGTESGGRYAREFAAVADVGSGLRK